MSRNDYKSTTANLKSQPLTKDEHRSRSLEGMANEILRKNEVLPKRRKKKTKKQRQAWWKGLSDSEKAVYLDEIVEKKRIKRNKAMVKYMKEKGLSFDCKKCIHGLTESCTDRPKNGCLYFADFINNVFGPKVA